AKPEDFEHTKIDLSTELTAPKTQKLAVLLPFNLKQFDDLEEKESEEEEESEEDILRRDAYLQISLDLYSGIKMALDSVQRIGIPVEAETYDTQRNSKKIAQILNQHNFD